MNQIAQHGFNYGQLAPVEAAEVRAASERIKIRMKRTAEDIVAIGQDLIATKQRLGHGQFGEWIKAEFDMGRQTATNLMNVAEKFGSEFPKIGNLTPSILYQLAAPSTPDEVVNRTIEAKRAGENVTTADVKRWKEEAQRAQREAEQAKREKAEQARRMQELEQQQRDATTRLEKAREEYVKLKNRPPERVEIEKIVEKVPEPYASLDQALQGRKNLLSDAERDLQKAQRELERIKTDIVAARHEKEREQNERSHQDDVKVKLASLKNGLVGLMKNYQEEFLVVGSDYLHHADAEMLRQVETHLRDLADKIAAVRGVSAEYAEFEVVNG